MAIYHLSVKAVSRSAGRSATAAAAYRAGCKITDERTGEMHDYTRKGGIQSTDIVLPDHGPEWAKDRAQLWNAAELAEKRKDACVAREFEVALPEELSPAERRRLALDFAKDMANREGCAVDVAIHAPGKEGDSRNHHAHILRTTRKVEEGGLGAKLDTEKAGRKRVEDLEAVRSRWAQMTNERLRENGIDAVVDHRSLQDQGIDRVPTKHLGPTATAIERRTKEPSRLRLDHLQEVSDRLQRAQEAGELARKSDQLDGFILDLSGNLAAAKAARQRALAPPQIDPRSRYHPDRIAARLAAEQEAQRSTAQEAQKAAERSAARAAEWAARAPKPAATPSLVPSPARASEARKDPSVVQKEGLEGLSLADLRVEIARLRPPSLDLAVEGDQVVREALQKKRDLVQLQEAAKAQEKAASQAQQRWREEHPAKAKMHDAGIWRSAELEAYGQKEAQARARWEALNPQVLQAVHQEKVAREFARGRVRMDQAPVLAKVAQLERIEQQKEAQLRVEREKDAALKKALSKFSSLATERRVKTMGFSDTGQKWKALPESLKTGIEQLNALAPAQRPLALEGLQKRLKNDPPAAERFIQSLSPVQQRDRGIER